MQDGSMGSWWKVLPADKVSLQTLIPKLWNQAMVTFMYVYTKTIRQVETLKYRNPNCEPLLSQTLNP